MEHCARAHAQLLCLSSHLAMDRALLLHLRDVHERSAPGQFVDARVLVAS